MPLGLFFIGGRVAAGAFIVAGVCFFFSKINAIGVTSACQNPQYAFWLAFRSAACWAVSAVASHQIASAK